MDDNEVEKIIGILIRAVQNQYIGKSVSREDFGDLHGAILVVGKCAYEPAKEYLLELTDSKDIDIKGEALVSLSKYSSIDPDLEKVLWNKAKSLLDEEDEEFQYQGFHVMTAFSSGHELESIQLAYHFLKDSERDIWARNAALKLIYSLASEQFKKSKRSVMFNFLQLDYDDVEKFEKMVKWDEVNEIVSSYDPDLLRE